MCDVVVREENYVYCRTRKTPKARSSTNMKAVKVCAHALKSKIKGLLSLLEKDE